MDESDLVHACLEGNLADHRVHLDLAGNSEVANHEVLATEGSVRADPFYGHSNKLQHLGLQDEAHIQGDPKVFDRVGLKDKYQRLKVPFHINRNCTITI